MYIFFIFFVASSLFVHTRSFVIGHALGVYEVARVIDRSSNRAIMLGPIGLPHIQGT